MYFNSLLILLYLCFSSFAYAEIYKDFQPFQTLKKAKENYPNGKFEEVKAAWVTGDDAFYKLSGVGIVGDIFLAFKKHDSYWQKELDQSESELDKLQLLENRWERALKMPQIESKIEFQRGKLAMPVDEKYQLSWVRWAPSEKIPLERLESRYGKVEEFGFSEDNFTPYCEWPLKSRSRNTFR